MNWKLPFLILSILFTSNFVYSQTIDRLELSLPVGTNPLANNSYTGDDNQFFQVRDSFSILINDDYRDHLVFFKFDNSNQLIKSVAIKTDTLQRQVRIQDAAYHNGFLYFISQENNGLIGKLDKDLNLIWVKIGPGFPLNSINCIKNRMYISMKYPGNYFLIAKYDLNGQYITARGWRDRVTQYQFKSDNFKSTIKSQQILYTVIDGTYGFGVPNPFHVLKIDTMLNLSNDRQISRNGGGNTLRFIDLTDNGQNIKIAMDISGSFNETNMELRIDKDLNVIDVKRYTALVNNQLITTRDRFHVRKGNVHFDIWNHYPGSANSIESSGDVIMRSNGGWNSPSIHHGLTYDNDPSMKYLGVYRSSYQTSYFRRKESFLSSGGNIQNDILEVVRVPGVVLGLACDSSLNAQYFPANPFGFTSSYAKYDKVSPQVPLTNITLFTEVLSPNQYPYCGYNNVDTCALLFVKIQSNDRRFCEGIKNTFSVNSRLADSIAWYVNGTFDTSSRYLEYTFDTVGNYTLVARAFSNTSACFYDDTLIAEVGELPTLLSRDTTICLGDSIKLRCSRADSILWTPSNPLTCNNCRYPWIKPTRNTVVKWQAINGQNCRVNESFNVNVYPVPSGRIDGSLTICPGTDSLRFDFTSSDSLNINWWIDTIGVITDDFRDSIYTSWSQPIDNSTIYAYLEFPAGCEGDTISFTVEVDTILNPQIANATNRICASDGFDRDYRIELINETSDYLWTANGGQINSGIDEEVVNLDWNSPGNHQLVLEEFSSNSSYTCYGADTFNITVNPSPDQQLNPVGFANICKDSTTSVQCFPIPPGSSYRWQFPFGFLDSIDDNFIRVRYTTGGDYDIIVQERNNLGCLGPEDTFQVTVHNRPRSNIFVEDTLICINKLFNNEYEAIGLAESFYDWEIKGGDIRSGDGTANILVDWDSTGGSKWLQLTETHQYGCPGDTIQYFFSRDIAFPEIYNISVNEDSTLTLDYQVKHKNFLPSNLMEIYRKSLFPVETPWELSGYMFRHLLEYTDHKALPWENNYVYKLEAVNSCDFRIRSNEFSTIWLEAKNDFNGANQGLKLEWSKMNGWGDKVRFYKIYQYFDNGLRILLDSTQDLSYEISNPLPIKNQCFLIVANHNQGLYESQSNLSCAEFDRPLNIPNVVTPNGDGRNDTFKVLNINNWPGSELEIYSRNGRSIFQSNPYQNNWPNEEIPSGVYFYKLRLSDDIQNSVNEFNGWIQVLH